MSLQPTTALPIPPRASEGETPDADLFYSSSLPKSGGQSGSHSNQSGASYLEAFEKERTGTGEIRHTSGPLGRRKSVAVIGHASSSDPDAVFAHKNKCKLVVTKFGGTSVGTSDRLVQVADIVK